MDVFVDSNLLVYLNANLPDEEAEALEEFLAYLLRSHDLYTNQLAVREFSYISAQYGLSLVGIHEIVGRIVLPFIEELPLDRDVFALARLYMLRYGLRASDSVHAATIDLYGLQAVASDDEDFDRSGIRRIWLDRMDGS